MTKATMTVIAVCSTLLWAGMVHASNVGGLPACKAKLAAAQKFPATGQRTSYTAGDDGAIKAGAALSYRDNGDGTITDNNTKLMWEKKDEAGGLHDVNNFYPWYGIFQWVAQLNAARFAGHTDWRIPNIKELQSIVDYGTINPAVAMAFNTSCQSSCTVNGAGGTRECSCTESGYYWSATTIAGDPGIGWLVEFLLGARHYNGKGDIQHVRAVRSGL